MRIAFLAAFLLVAGAGRTATASSAAAPARMTGVAAAKPVLPFLYDDYPKALALARARKVPLFIESWAPW